MNRAFHSHSFLFLAASAVMLACSVTPTHAANKDIPQWALDAAKTHTPSYVGDASRVILFDEYVETIDAQGRATEREREAFRILKPQGRESGCSVCFDVDEKINYFRAWTIGADEKQYQAKDTDFTDVGDGAIPVMLSTEKARVLHPPAADVGAVVICESEEVLAPYQQEEVWRVQVDAPFVFEAMELDLPPGMNYAVSWHRYDPIKPVEVSPNHWRWELRDVNALDVRDVKSRPSRAALAARVSVSWGERAVEGVDNQWRALGQRVVQLEEHRPDPTPELSAKAQELVAGAPDFYTKVKNVTQYIQKNIQYFVVERGIGGWQAHFAGDVFRNACCRFPQTGKRDCAG